MVIDYDCGQQFTLYLEVPNDIFQGCGDLYDLKFEDFQGTYSTQWPHCLVVQYASVKVKTIVKTFD